MNKEIDTLRQSIRTMIINEMANERRITEAFDTATPSVKSSALKIEEILKAAHTKFKTLIQKEYGDRFKDFKVYLSVDDDGEVDIQIQGDPISGEDELHMRHQSGKTGKFYRDVPAKNFERQW